MVPEFKSNRPRIESEAERLGRYSGDGGGVASGVGSRMIEDVCVSFGLAIFWHVL